MPEPIPDFAQNMRHAATRTLLERSMHWHPAHERAIKRLSDGLSSVADGGKRSSI
ncbi:hypothetical protein [Thioalkalivibrio sp.]|uniref:hypothetical protein n=1 Tax=Thioalkalivibrio sp. TaxID=2093813 RepID=UPI0025E53C46|nr:hypothetical protein [Thioalkalivibrio sp.]